MQQLLSLCKRPLCVKASVHKSFSVHKPLCVRIPARKSCYVSRLLCVTTSGCRHVLVQNASPERIQVQMLDVVSAVADGDDARRAPQGVILAVLNQLLKAVGTNYFLRVIAAKRHFFDIFFDILSGIRSLSHILSDILSGSLSGKSSEILCS